MPRGAEHPPCAGILWIARGDVFEEFRRAGRILRLQSGLRVGQGWERLGVDTDRCDGDQDDSQKAHRSPHVRSSNLTILTVRRYQDLARNVLEGATPNSARNAAVK